MHNARTMHNLTFGSSSHVDVRRYLVETGMRKVLGACKVLGVSKVPRACEVLTVCIVHRAFCIERALPPVTVR
jgi:hypothetical protein